MSPHFISQLSIRLRNSKSQDVLAAAGVISATAAVSSFWWFTSTPDHQVQTKEGIVPSSLVLHPRMSSFGAKFPLHNILSTTSQFTFCETMNNNSSTGHHPSSSIDVSVDPNQIIMECDYVVVGGNGKAGKSAVRTLRKLDPNASICIIDPNSDNNNICVGG